MGKEGGGCSTTAGPRSLRLIPLSLIDRPGLGAAPGQETDAGHSAVISAVLRGLVFTLAHLSLMCKTLLLLLKRDVLSDLLCV